MFGILQNGIRLRLRFKVHNSEQSRNVGPILNPKDLLKFSFNILRASHKLTDM
jgi:hypothetical protein